MGFGISCTCTKCNAKQEFFLGVGYLNFADPINPTEKLFIFVLNVVTGKKKLFVRMIKKEDNVQNVKLL